MSDNRRRLGGGVKRLTWSPIPQRRVDVQSRRCAPLPKLGNHAFLRQILLLYVGLHRQVNGNHDVTPLREGQTCKEVVKLLSVKVKSCFGDRLVDVSGSFIVELQVGRFV